MKIKELIKRLEEVEYFEPTAKVYITTEKSTYDFTGFGVDDNRDVEIYVVDGDKEA